MLVVSAAVLVFAAGCNSKPNSGNATADSKAPPTLALAAGDATDNQPAASGNGQTGAAQDGQSADQSSVKTDEQTKAAAQDPTAKLDDETKATIKLLQDNLKAWQDNQPYDFQPAAARIEKRLEHDFNEVQIELAAEAGDLFMHVGSYDLAKQIYTVLEKEAAKSDDAKLVDKVKQMIEPDLTKLNLLGTKPKIEGTIFGGETFDWSKYKGKVVLLDFWATWCKPCRAELPNVKKAYEKFHDQGFDVVGISLDDNKEDLAKFLEHEQLPWQILFSDDAAKQGWEGAAMTNTFAITAIPATFLLDRSGKLVSLSARGEDLAPQIEKLLAEKQKQ